MRAGPLAHDRRAILARRHPLAKLGAAALLMGGLFLSRGPVGPALAATAIVVAIPASGLSPRLLLPRCGPVIAAAAGLGVFNGLVSGDLPAGAVLALRLAGIAVSGVIALATIEPTELADGLIQHLRVPHRFAVGTLAALQLLPLFAREWEIGGLARRARGLDADRGHLGRIAAFPARARGLLVAAVRRGTALAVAMDARGFGSRPCRTLARPRAIDGADVALMMLAGALAALAVAAGLA